MKRIIRPELRSYWCSVADEGLQFEISAGIDGLEHQLVTILADEQDESLWVEIYVNDIAVQIPIETLRDAIDAAIGGVRPESWYDKNLPSGGDA